MRWPGPYGSLFVTAMMLGRVLVVSAPKPSFLPRIADQLLRIAQRDSLFSRKSFRALPNQHHVRAFLEDRASHQNGILHPLQRGSRASTQRRAVHHNGVALHAAVPVGRSFLEVAMLSRRSKPQAWYWKTTLFSMRATARTWSWMAAGSAVAGVRTARRCVGGGRV